MIEEKTLFREPKTADDPPPDKITDDFMKVARDDWTQTSEHFSQIEFLLETKDSVSNIDDPATSNKRTNIALLHNALQKAVEQMQKPHFQLFAAEAPENVRATMQGLGEDVLKHAGWDRVLTDKKSGAQRFMLETGDAIIGYGSNPSGTFPLQYFKEEPNRYFKNPDAIEIRCTGSEKSVRKRVIIKEYPWDEAVAFYPELEGNATLGALPSWHDSTDLRFKELQEALVKQRRIQIAFCSDIDYLAADGKRGLHCMIAGGNKFKFGQVEGADYPSKDRFGDPIFPEDKLVCFPRFTGFWNYGFLQVLYKVGVMHSKLMNMGITYTLTNSNPVRIIASNKSEEEVASKMTKAMNRGAEGKLPIMVAADGKDFGGVTTTHTPAIINEVNIVLELLEKQVGQMGVNLNSIMTDTAKTLGALQLEVASAVGVLKYIQSTNAPPYTFLIENGFQLLADRKGDDSDIPLVSSVKIRTADGGEEEVNGVSEKDEFGQPVRDELGKVKTFRSFNLEDFKNLWNAYHWKVVVSGGVVNNPVLEDALDRNIQASHPESRAAKRAAAAMYQRHGRNYTEEDFSSPTGQPPQTSPNLGGDLPT